MEEALGEEQSVSAHPEHGDLSLGWVVGSLCGRTAHWVAAIHNAIMSAEHGPGRSEQTRNAITQ